MNGSGQSVARPPLRMGILCSGVVLSCWQRHVWRLLSQLATWRSRPSSSMSEPRRGPTGFSGCGSRACSGGSTTTGGSSDGLRPSPESTVATSLKASRPSRFVRISSAATPNTSRPLALEQLRTLQLDALLRFGFGILRGDVLGRRPIRDLVVPSRRRAGHPRRTAFLLGGQRRPCHDRSAVPAADRPARRRDPAGPRRRSAPSGTRIPATAIERRLAGRFCPPRLPAPSGRADRS